MPEEKRDNQSDFLKEEPTRLLERIAETDKVDYKAKFSKEYEDRYNTIKVFAAMANSGGGLVIYGVQKQNLVGIDDVQEKLLDPARLKGLLNDFLSPVPSISTEIVSFQSKNFAYVSIEGITFPPVLIAKSTNDSHNNQVLRAGAFYIRDNTESVEATTESQVRRILERAINYEVRRRLSEMLPVFFEQKQAIREVPAIEVIGRRQAKEFSEIESSTPIREVVYYVESEKPLEASELKDLFKLSFKLGGLDWPEYSIYAENNKDGKSEDGFISIYKQPDNSRRAFARIDPDGSVYSCATLLEDDYATWQDEKSDRYQQGVGVYLTLNLVTLAVRLGHAYLQKLDTVDHLTLNYALRNVRDRKLFVEDPAHFDFHSDQVSFDENVTAKVVIRRTMANEDLIRVIRDLLVKLYDGFNWSGYSSDQMENFIQKAFGQSQLVQRQLTV